MKKNRAIAIRACFLGAISAATLVACGGGTSGGTTGQSDQPPGQPPSTTYSLSASVSGLAGTGLELVVNGGSPVPVAKDGTITLATGLSAGTAYTVSIASQPAQPVQACTLGGGSGTVSANSSVSVSCATSPATSQTAAQISLDSSIPSQIQSSISRVVTGWGSGQLNSWVPIQLLAQGADSIALAVDSTGSVVLAGMVSSQQVTLSADSTATALVRLLLANSAQTGTAAQQNAAIQSAAGYSDLVSLVSSDLQKGVRPLGDTQVVTQLFAVAASAVSNLPTSQGSPARIKDQLGPPPINGYTQYTVIDGVLQALLFVKPTEGTKTIEIDNLMPMPWTVQSETADSNGPSQPLGNAQTIPAVGLVLAGTATLPMTNSPFNLHIYNNDSDSLQRIANSFLGNLLASTIDVIMSRTPAAQSCKAQVIAGLGKLSLPTITDDGSFLTTLQRGLTDVISPGTIQPLFESCGAQLGVTFAVVYTAIKQVYLKDLLSILDGAAEGSLVVKVNDTVDEAYYANKYWDKTYTVGICAASDYSIQSCVASFSFSPTQLLMAPGATQLVAVTGVDSSGKDTALPGDLQITPNDPSVATITGNPSFTATAVAVGSTSVVLLDPSTGATNAAPVAMPYPVSVAVPTLSPSATTFTVSGSDQTLTVSLVGPKGEPPCGIAPVEPCINLPSGITWQPSSANSTETPVTTTGSAGTWTIPANATPGPITVTASDSNGNQYGPVTIQVAANNGCVPPAGATTCSVALFAIPGDGNHSGFQAPVQAQVTETEVDNGQTTTQTLAATLGSTIYANVPGVCVIGAPGCLPLSYYSYQLCEVDGTFAPSSYSSIVSGQATLAADCTGSPSRSDVITGYTLSASGLLQTHYETKHSQNLTCNVPVSGGTDHRTSVISDDEIQTISYNLADGSGSAADSVNSSSASTDSVTNANNSNTVTISGSVTWSPEKTQPPVFAGTGIGVSYSQVLAGQPLPPACAANTNAAAATKISP